MFSGWCGASGSGEAGEQCVEEKCVHLVDVGRCPSVVRVKDEVFHVFINQGGTAREAEKQGNWCNIGAILVQYWFNAHLMIATVQSKRAEWTAHVLCKKLLSMNAPTSKQYEMSQKGS